MEDGIWICTAIHKREVILNTIAWNILQRYTIHSILTITTQFTKCWWFYVYVPYVYTMVCIYPSSVYRCILDWCVVFHCVWFVLFCLLLLYHPQPPVQSIYIPTDIYLYIVLKNKNIPKQCKKTKKMMNRNINTWWCACSVCKLCCMVVVVRRVDEKKRIERLNFVFKLFRYVQFVVCADSGSVCFSILVLGIFFGIIWLRKVKGSRRVLYFNFCRFSCTFAKWNSHKFFLFIFYCFISLWFFSFLISYGKCKYLENQSCFVIKRLFLFEINLFFVF